MNRHMRISSSSTCCCSAGERLTSPCSSPFQALTGRGALVLDSAEGQIVVHISSLLFPSSRWCEALCLTSVEVNQASISLQPLFLCLLLMGRSFQSPTPTARRSLIFFGSARRTGRFSTNFRIHCCSSSNLIPFIFPWMPIASNSSMSSSVKALAWELRTSILICVELEVLLLVDVVS